MAPFLNIATEAAKRSKHRAFFHGCVIVRAGSLVSQGANHDNVHAEIAALQKIWPNKRKGCLAVSIRVTRGGLLAEAKPCLDCQKALKENGIKKVYYSTANRTIELMKL